LGLVRVEGIVSIGPELRCFDFESRYSWTHKIRSTSGSFRDVLRILSMDRVTLARTRRVLATNNGPKIMMTRIGRMVSRVYVKHGDKKLPLRMVKGWPQI